MKFHSYLRLVAFLLSGLLLFSLGAVAEPTTGAPEAADRAAVSLPAGMVTGLENENWRVYVDTATGRFGLEDKAGGAVWWSTPEGAEDDMIANGKTLMEMQSNLLVRYADMSSEKQEMDTTNSYAAAVRHNNVAVTVEGNRIRIAYKMADYRLYVPLDLTLDEQGLTCAVATDDILEGGDYRIYSLTLLPYFGAGNADDEGYLLVPDGSGALIRFNNGKQLYTQYSATTFGKNLTADVLNDSQSDEDVRMPVYGICKNGDSVLAVLDKGAALARIEAGVGGLTSEYNQAYATFSLRTVDTYYIGQSLGNSSKVTLLEEGPFEIDSVSVRLMPVTAERGEGYVGMAKTYREYLVASGMKKPDTYRQELHLQILGSLRRTEHFLGIPYESTVTVTSLKETRAILDRLHRDAVDNVAVRYMNWNKKTMKGKASSKLSVIGGKATLNALVNTAEGYGMAVYPDTAWNVVSAFSFAAPKWSCSARTLGNKPVAVYEYSFVNFFKDTLKQPRYLLAPFRVEELVGKFLPRYNKLGVEKLGFADLADTLSADFGPERWTREHTLLAMQRIAAAAAEKNGLLFTGGNAYALPYAERVMGAPTVSSGFDVADTDVPFYQIALYGYVPTSGTAVNLAEEDTAVPLLRALESGSSVSYVWTASDSKRLNDSDYESWYSTKYTVWYEQAAEYGKVLQDFSALVAGSDIVAHEMLECGVRRTTWSNGVEVLVNYGDESTVKDGETVEAKSYIIKEGSL